MVHTDEVELDIELDDSDLDNIIGNAEDVGDPNGEPVEPGEDGIVEPTVEVDPIQELTTEIKTLEAEITKSDEELENRIALLDNDPKEEKALEKEKDRIEKQKAKLTKLQEKKVKLVSEKVLEDEKKEKEAKKNAVVEGQANKYSEQAETDAKYPRLVGTPIKFVLDVFFDRFHKNGDILRANGGIAPEGVKIMSVTEIYDYFNRYLEKQGDIMLKEKELEAIAEVLEQDESNRNEYNKLEFALFYYSRMYNNEQNRYDRNKIVYDKQVQTLFNEMRKDFGSDASCNSAIGTILAKQSETLESMKADVSLARKNVETYTRLAEHIKSCNIRILAENKRLDTMESAGRQTQE